MYAVRPRRHAHADAPGRVPRRGHLRPAGAARPSCPALLRARRGRRRRAAATAPPSVVAMPCVERRERRRDGRRRGSTSSSRADARGTEPPEARGLARDGVRMLVAAPRRRRARCTARSPPARRSSTPATSWSSTRRRRCPPRSTPSRADGTPLVVHLSTRARRRPLGRRAAPTATATLTERGRPPPPAPRLPGGATRPWSRRYLGGARLVARRRSTCRTPLLAYLAGHGRPIRYGYVDRPWPLDAYQNVYADEPGSAEMPSAAGRSPPSSITALVAKGVGVAPARAAHRRRLARGRRAALPRARPGARPRPPAASTPPAPAAAGSSPSAPPWCARWSRPRDADGTRRGRSTAGPTSSITPERGRARGRRAAHRLARARGVAPADARGRRRPRAPRALLRAPPRRAATSGTSSATST